MIEQWQFQQDLNRMEPIMPIPDIHIDALDLCDFVGF